MPTLSAAEIVESLAAGLAAVRMAGVGLAGRQAALFSFLLFNAITQFALASTPVTSASYFWAFIGYTVFNWFFCIFAAREVFALSLGDYPGIRTAARWTLYTTTVFSIFIAVALTAWLWGSGRNGRSHFFYIQIADRSITFTLAVIIGGLLIFLARYPLHLSANTYVSCRFFGAVLICQALIDLADSLRKSLYSPWIDLAGVVAGAVLYLGWAARLARERISGKVQEAPENPDESDLLRQLQAMNRLLSRVGQR